MYKRIIGIIILVTMALCLLTPVNASSDIKVSINGKSINLSAKPYIAAGVLYLPAKDTISTLKGKLSFSNNKISVDLNGVKAQMVLAAKTANINGKITTIKNSPVLKNKILYFPLDLYHYFYVSYTFKNGVMNFLVPQGKPDTFEDRYPVYVNGSQTGLFGKVKNQRGLVYLPLKLLMKELKYEIEDIQGGISIKTEISKVIAYTDGTCLKDGIKQKMDNPAENIGGQLFVPVTWIPKLFNVYAEVSPEQNCIFIMEKSNSPADQGYLSLKSNNGSQGYFDGTISGSTLNVKGMVKPNLYVWVMLDNSSGKTVVDANVPADSSGFFNAALALPALPEGAYTFNIFTASQQYNVEYRSLYYGIPMEEDEGLLRFKGSPVLEDNKVQMRKDASADPARFTSKTASKEISGLVADLTDGLNEPAEKVKVIHDWVASNIYYDWDAYNNQKVSLATVSADYTLKDKRSVCQGYAELFMAMVREAGIPCRFVSGKAISPGMGETWDNVNKDEADHAWNEVYFDGSWRIMDVTWDSGNRYENGQFTKGNTNDTYYDPTLEFFSMDHKIIGR